MRNNQSATQSVIWVCPLCTFGALIIHSYQIQFHSESIAGIYPSCFHQKHCRGASSRKQGRAVPSGKIRAPQDFPPELPALVMISVAPLPTCPQLFSFSLFFPVCYGSALAWPSVGHTQPPSVQLLLQGL